MVEATGLVTLELSTTLFKKNIFIVLFGGFGYFLHHMTTFPLPAVVKPGAVFQYIMNIHRELSRSDRLVLIGLILGLIDQDSSLSMESPET